MVSFLGVFQIAIAYAFFSYGLKRVFAVEASIISMTEPVLTPLWVFIGYGEVPATTAILGGIIILTAISVRTIQMGRSLIFNWQGYKLILTFGLNIINVKNYYLLRVLNGISSSSLFPFHNIFYRVNDFLFPARIQNT